jgi:hypothetical protein
MKLSSGYTGDDHIIEGLIGDGLTMLGSQEVMHARSLIAQMATAVSSGKPLFDTLAVKQGHVLTLHNNKADGQLMARRLSRTEGVSVESYSTFRSHRRLGSGLGEFITIERKRNPDLRLVVMFGFSEVKQALGDWLKKSPDRLSELSNEDMARPHGVGDEGTGLGW